MLLHQGLPGCANCVKGIIDTEIKRKEEKSARHHHQTVLGMWGRGQYLGGGWIKGNTLTPILPTVTSEAVFPS